MKILRFTWKKESCHARRSERSQHCNCQRPSAGAKVRLGLPPTPLPMELGAGCWVLGVEEALVSLITSRSHLGPVCVYGSIGESFLEAFYSPALKNIGGC